MKDNIKKQFKERIKWLCKIKLNSGNLTRATNIFDIPVLTYSFGLLKWSHTDLDDLERIIRTVTMS